jgi:hypothetical protein
MVVVAVFALLALVSIISIVESAEDIERSSDLYENPRLWALLARR